MEQQANKIRLTLSTQAERYARQDAPRDTRLMAARGALPLPPIELATVLFVLHHDPDAEVKDTARYQNAFGFLSCKHRSLADKTFRKPDTTSPPPRLLGVGVQGPRLPRKAG